MVRDAKVEISAEIKVVVSTRDDQIRSHGSGTHVFDRRQVIHDALDGLHRRMRTAYRRVA